MNTQSKNLFSIALAALCLTCISISCTERGGGALPRKVTMSEQELMDKIKGGWAGQTIGVTYGGPTEFAYRGVMIGDDVRIPWDDEDYIASTMKNSGWLYDDIYMDLTFVQMIDRLGIDVPADSVAVAFACAPYPLWHANQAARYNIRHGIMPPMSGHWTNNPHADDIDYQIEADYAGLMCPAMPNLASWISDRIGHIMNYGDGWYGGVYMGAMYSLAFVTDDIPTIVATALRTIPEQSKFHKCMSEVIEFWKNNPDDWKKAWQMCQERWNDDAGCGEGVFAPLNIDAVINSAYVIIGLLYGEGDFGRTIDISTRCGQDSDCNPASAGGILGTAIGYSAIPAKWLDPLKKAEDIVFSYTDMSLNDTYRMSYRHALQMIEREGGKVADGNVTIRVQRPEPVHYEKSFEGIIPSGRLAIGENLSDTYTFNARCAAALLCGYVSCPDKRYEALIQVTIDGEKMPVSVMPASGHERKLDIYWNYDLAEQEHTFTVQWLNPRSDAVVRLQDAVLYLREKAEPAAADSERL